MTVFPLHNAVFDKIWAWTEQNLLASLSQGQSRPCWEMLTDSRGVLSTLLNVGRARNHCHKEAKKNSDVYNWRVKSRYAFGSWHLRKASYCTLHSGEKDIKTSENYTSNTVVPLPSDCFNSFVNKMQYFLRFLNNSKVRLSAKDICLMRSYKLSTRTTRNPFRILLTSITLNKDWFSVI